MGTGMRTARLESEREGDGGGDGGGRKPGEQENKRKRIKLRAFRIGPVLGFGYSWGCGGMGFPGRIVGLGARADIFKVFFGEPFRGSIRIMERSRRECESYCSF
ncbi:hypothetical protein GWI33_005643 [Rhynchophorus ferrugineus]|uniref:Uncharacterized protein n=1 Tax=Rhynchophorus ferrugineus TaxID=354439 RepID=A0A834IVQ4_RHYFE|nr:hypothetical protein GWI33_005643 [Rhynchophorus ferrugineus]